MASSGEYKPSYCKLEKLSSHPNLMAKNSNRGILRLNIIVL